jgi:hypothetical protein
MNAQGTDAPREVGSHANAEVTAAEAGVARAGRAFSASLHDASLAGADAAKRVVSVARPVLIGVGILACGLLAVRLVRGPRARRPAAAGGSFWPAVGRATAIAFVSVAGRHLAARWLGAEANREVRRFADMLK